MFAIPVAQKGIDDTEWSVRKMVQAIYFMGYKEIIAKVDQESSLNAVVDTERTFKGNDTGLWERPAMIGKEQSPIKDSRANGMIERTVRTVEGHVRTLKSALQRRLQRKR